MDASPQKALQAELPLQTSPKQKQQPVSQSGSSMLWPSGWGHYLLGFVLWLYHPLQVSVAEDEGPVKDGQSRVYCHDADDQRVYHGSQTFKKLFKSNEKKKVCLVCAQRVDCV